MTINPLETIKTTGISKVPNHKKHANIIIEPSPVYRQGKEVYTIPGYTFLKAGSKWMGLALRNLSSRPVTLKRGTIVACIMAANEIPPKLSPKIIMKASSVNVHPGVHLSVGVKIKRKSSKPDVQ